jgi:hypothetical protein
MANFKINFEITTGEYDAFTPLYKVKLTTALLNPNQESAYDGFLLLIERKDKIDGPVDTFYGIIKPTDFKMIGKRRPNKNQNFYRVDTWTLVFYNEQTMNEALELMKAQVDSVAAGVAILSSEQAHRSVTHLSPSF